ncbi:membrane protein of unknown function [Rhizobium leguminosarum]|uniref:MFS transporter n=1 Tax=Rhizobium leguminosarum TaxID=384 RepID=A0A2K9Z3I4_RHILE|nr:membrane protein of unknown function [Rhizobium leguminosarum]
MTSGCALSIALSLRQTPSARSALQTTGHGTWRLPHLLYLVPICFTLSLGGTFRNAWAGPYLTDVFGHGTNVGAVLTAVSVFGIATSFVLPFALPRWRGRRIVTATYVVGVLSALLLAFSPGASIFAASAGLAFLYAMGNVHPVAMTEAQALLPTQIRGIGLGALNTLVFLGVSASSSVFGARRASFQRGRDLWPDFWRDGHGACDCPWSLRGMSSEGYCRARGRASVRLKATSRSAPTPSSAAANLSPLRRRLRPALGCPPISPRLSARPSGKSRCRCDWSVGQT